MFMRQAVFVVSLALAPAAHSPRPRAGFPGFRRQFRRSWRRSIPCIKATSANTVRKRLNYSLLCLRRGRKTAFTSPPTRPMAPTHSRLSTCTNRGGRRIFPSLCHCPWRRAHVGRQEREQGGPRQRSLLFRAPPVSGHQCQLPARPKVRLSGGCPRYGERRRLDQRRTRGALGAISQRDFISIGRSTGALHVATWAFDPKIHGAAWTERLGRRADQRASG